jgi:multiple sugar transport system substrate-binding protein
MRGLRLVTLAAIPVLAFAACSSTASSAPSSGTSSAPQSNQVRWFVGLGSGTQPAQIDLQKTFVANYNKSNKDGITLKLEIVPNANAYDTLKTEIAAGNAPDIIGPVGVKGRNGFSGLFLDLTSEIAKNNYDIKQFPASLTTFVQQGAKGIIGIPYDIYPGYIWYNKDIFTKNSLPALPTKIAGATYQGSAWTWDTLGKVAAGLTVDANGKISTDPAFDATKIVQYGMDFQWTGDLKRLASSFGSGNLVAADGKTAQIPASWEAGLEWYYNAVHVAHIVPDGTAEGSTLLAGGNSQSSGNIAMNAAYGWSISSLASDAATAKVKTWDMGVWPAFNGATSAPMDIDTFVIAAASKNPDAAFKAMLAIEADGGLMKMYGGEPALTSAQAAYFTAFDATLAPIFPGNKVTWSVLGEDEAVAPAISHEADMPNFNTSWNDANAAFTKLQNTDGLVVKDVMDALKTKLQADFDAAQPLLNQ